MSRSSSVEIQTPNKKSFDILKKTFDPEYSGNWSGMSDKTNIFLNVYIKEKYKKELFFLDYFTLVASYSEGEYPHSVFTADLKELDENKYHFITKKTIKEELLPYINAYKNSKKRFHFFDISMMIRDKPTNQIKFHSASAIYDSSSNQVDFFNLLVGDFNVKAYNEKFKIFFRSIYGEQVKLKYSNTCLLLGQTELRNFCEEDYYKNSKFYIGGNCVIWTLWFLDMRLKNKHLTHQEVLKKSLKLFTETPELVCEVIKNYGIFADKIMKKYDLVVDKKNKTVNIIYKETVENNRILKMIFGSLTMVMALRIIYKKFKKIS